MYDCYLNGSEDIAWITGGERSHHNQGFFAGMSWNMSERKGGRTGGIMERGREEGREGKLKGGRAEGREMRRKGGNEG